MPRLATPALACALACALSPFPAPAPAHAQPAPARVAPPPGPAERVRLPETDEASPDPLGSGGLHDLPTLLDDETRAIEGRARAAAEAARVAPPVAGAVITAAAPVRESAHDVAVRFAVPVAEVRHRIVLRNPSRYRAEVRYTLAVPGDAALTELAVVAGAARIEGAPTAEARDGYDALALRAAEPRVAAESAAPTRDGRGPETAAPTRDGRGRETAAPTPFGRARVVPAAAEGEDATIVVDVAPLEPDGELEVVVAYAVSVRERGGVARLFLPPRGADRRTVEGRVTVEPVGLGAPRLWGRAVEPAGEALPGWAALALDADVPAEAATSGTLHRLRCEGGARARPCAVLRVAAGRRPPVSERVIVLLDASPSTLGPARGRIAPALAAVLAEAAPESTVQVLAFAARARALVPEPIAPGAAPFGPIAEAVSGEDLGSATRFEATWPTVRAWARDAKANGEAPHVVLLGDGGLTDGEDARRAFADARRERVRVSYVNVGDREARRALVALAETTGGEGIDAGPAADLAERGRAAAPLRETVRRLFAPAARVAGESLSAGEARVEVRAGAMRAPAGAGVAVMGAAAEDAGVVARWAAGRLFAGRRVWTTTPGPMPRPTPTPTPTPTPGPSPSPSPMPSPSPTPSPMPSPSPTPSQMPSPGPTATPSPSPTPSPAPTPPTPDPGPPLSLAFARESAPPPQRAVDAADAIATTDSTDSTATTDSAATTDSTATTDTPPTRGVVPREILLDNLRTRILPAARGCLRDDRRGRLAYSVRAVFRFRLEDREVTAADVEGTARDREAITDELRACLMRAVDTLDVPRFPGAIVVRYPIYTLSVQAEPPIEIAPDVRERLRESFGAPGPESWPRF